MLDAIPGGAALIDGAGLIAATNNGWTAIWTSAEIPPYGIGSDYLAICRNLHPEGFAAHGDAASWLGEILAGTRQAVSFSHPEVAAEPKRWFRTHFSRLTASPPHTALVMHLDATETTRVERQLYELAHFDPLTGLPNRLLFLDRLQQAMARAQRLGEKLAVIYADLDRFKLINDTLGHSTGDGLLRQFALRLASGLRKSDALGRLDGDAFVLALPGLKNEEEAGVVARKLIATLKPSFQVEDREVFASASLGLSIYPDDATDCENLVRHAESAMYRAKEAGRNGYRFFTPAMDEHASLRLRFDNELRQALARGEFTLFYQPKLSCTSGAIVGAEALIRWRHPVRGLVSPAEFIPILEELNLIDEVGTWVIGETCRQIARWQEKGIEAPTVAVNLSARQLDGNRLLATVRHALDSNGLRPDRLELELTESHLMRNVDEIVPLLAELRQLGVKLSVDDFGTGYSSLSYLKQFPLDAVKVDRSFVQDITADPDDASITRAVITMAHQLKLRVVAEGVETEGQVALLVANQCDEIQGFFFSRPVPPDELETMIREKRGLAPELLRPGNRERTILLVDDEENILSSLRRLLRRDGYRILAASGGAEGLELLAKNAVDVIVSDQRMPTMTGVEFLRRVKTIHPDTVRIVLSGYTELQSITDAINEGAIYKFLTKPWDDDQLRANIEEAFRYKELGDENRRLGHQLQVANVELARSNQQLQELLDANQARMVRDETMLGVVQAVLYQVPIPIVGIDDAGMIVFANGDASTVLADGRPLLGSFASECMPPPLAGLLSRPRGESLLWHTGGVPYVVHCRPMGGQASGTLVTLVPTGSDDA